MTVLSPSELYVTLSGILSVDVAGTASAPKSQLYVSLPSNPVEVFVKVTASSMHTSVGTAEKLAV